MLFRSNTLPISILQKKDLPEPGTPNTKPFPLMSFFLLPIFTFLLIVHCKGGWHDVTLRYDDNAPDVVVATLKLVNVPTEPKLPQTGDNANPLLYLGIGALALITGVGVGLRGRKKKKNQ